jgi:hypothetical protein
MPEKQVTAPNHHVIATIVYVKQPKQISNEH